MRTCSINDCAFRARTKGYCIAHYGRLLRGQKVDAPLRHRALVKECSVGWCDRRLVANGLCQTHWQREREGRDMDAPFRINKKPPIYKNCPTCEKEYTVSPSGAYRKYCSRRCAGLTRVGSKSFNWKGGITGVDQAERNRFGKELRDLVFARDEYTCQVCQADNVYLQVDHIKRWSEFPELRFDMNNCRTLCHPCHYYVTFRRKMPKGSRWGLSKRQVGIKDLA